LKRFLLALLLIVFGAWLGATLAARSEQVPLVHSETTAAAPPVDALEFPVIEPLQASRCANAGYLRASESALLNERNEQVVLAGINWFGFETDFFAPLGLNRRRLGDLLDQVADLGFNTIRLPFSNQLLERGHAPRGIDYELNPELAGLSGIDLLDKVIEAASDRCLKVILDRHRPEASAQSSLWYTRGVSEDRWIADWRMLASRYLANDTVIGFDLHNEPSGSATWGSGDLSTDWRLAAERAGNSILEVNPMLLIIVQGVQDQAGRHYWWGGNLVGARGSPVRLSVPGRLVYGPHDYGPGLHAQPWFTNADFPSNLPDVWDQFWGYLQKDRIAPILVGEFGGLAKPGDPETEWQSTLIDYVQRNRLSYCYWALNPDPVSPGGLLLADWTTADPVKLSLLQPILQPKPR
jgi:endoglucanase